MAALLRKLVTFFIPLWLFFALPPSLLALEPVILEAKRGKYPLGLHLEFLEDPGGKLTFKDVSDPALQNRWVKNKQEVPYFAFSSSTYWLRLKIKNPEGQNKDHMNMLLELAKPLHDYLDVFIDNGSGELKIIKTGDRRPFDTREKKHRHFIFGVQTPPGHISAVYLRFQSHDGFHPTMPLVLWKADEFITHAPIQDNILGALLGTLVVIALYNLFIFSSLRDRSYLYYVLFLAGAALNLAAHYGFANLFFWPDSPDWANLVTPLSMGIFALYSNLFTRSFLNTARFAPRIDLFLRGLAALYYIYFIFAIFGPHSLSLRITIPFAIVGSISCIIAGVTCLKEGHRPALYYLLALFIMLCGIFLMGLRISRVIPSNYITENGFSFGLLLLVILLSLGLADRINIMRDENDAARERALQVQKDAALNLELKVEERTRELARANEKLQQMDKAKTAFFANVSHEFRTPLTLILSPVESIINGDFGDKIGKTNTIFRSLLQNGLRLLRLINNLLDFTKIEAGRMSLNKQKTDLVKFLKYYIAGVQSGVESKGLRLAFNDNTGGLFGYIDRNLMDKAIMNLLSNAFKFTPAGGDIVIELDKVDGEFFALAVKDTGVGVPNDKLHTIFERFSQADVSASRKYEGTGIGLSLTKEIVELHGGKITVRNRSARGAAFTITIPIGTPDNPVEIVAENDYSNSDSIEPIEDIEEIKPYLMADFRESSVRDGQSADALPGIESPGQNVSGTRKHTILMVEDNHDMVSFLFSLLERDYFVQTAANGKEGLAKALKIKPDLILSDVMMPEMDGYEMTNHLKSAEETRDVPIILLSAKSDVMYRVEGLEFGADDYLSKPFNAKELLARIHNQIEGKRLERELKREKTERDEEFLQAARVQKNILTSRTFIEQIDELEIDFLYLPMNSRISGDYYNISRAHNGQNSISIFLADAMGHGTQAALSTMQIDMLYRENLKKNNPARRFEDINNKFVSEIHNEDFFTGIIVNIHDNKIRYSSAGHPAQFLIQTEKKQIQRLDSTGGLVGVVENQTYEVREFATEKGDVLLLFTDGIYEFFTAEDDEFGGERFQTLIQEELQNGLFTRPINTILTSIMADLDKFRSEESFRDDITLFAFRIK